MVCVAGCVPTSEHDVSFCYSIICFFTSLLYLYVRTQTCLGPPRTNNINTGISMLQLAIILQSAEYNKHQA